MRWPLPLLLALLLAGLVFPALAADGNKIGYVSFREVSLSLQDRNARVDIDYTLDPGMDLVVIIFGAGDLEKKLERSLNFPMLRIEDVGLTHAVFTADDVALDYGGGAYWFPAHSFGVTFPLVEVRAPGCDLTFTDSRTIPQEFGYFGDKP